MNDTCLVIRVSISLLIMSEVIFNVKVASEFKHTKKPSINIFKHIILVFLVVKHTYLISKSPGLLGLCKWTKWKSLSHVRLFATPWTVVHGILQARILEWLAFPVSRGSSQPRDWTQVSRIAGRFLTSWATRKAQEYWSG